MLNVIQMMYRVERYSPGTGKWVLEDEKLSYNAALSVALSWAAIKVEAHVRPANPFGRR